MNEMRRLMTLLEAPQAPRQPYIDAHRAGAHTVEIEMMWVPTEQRGKGVGRRYYEEWEAQLPPDIHVVQLWAADTGSGLSTGFWEAMGFDYKYDPDEFATVSDETLQWMWKGVNGHPTPESIYIPPDPLEDEE